MTQDQIYQRCYARDRAARVNPLDRHYHPGQTWAAAPKPGELEYLAGRAPTENWYTEVNSWR